MYRITATVQKPEGQRPGENEPVDVDSLPRAQVAQRVREFLKRGYWVEVHHEESAELMAGPYDPDEEAPKYVI